MFELDEIMRQRESKMFAEILNRLREGKHTTTDLQKLKERCVQESNCPQEAPRLFIPNALVDKYNEQNRSHPRNDLPPPPPEVFGTAPQSFCTPANYISFELIGSYLIILTTKFVKLPILWSQISPCRPRKHSRTQSPSYARSTERDEGLWPKP
jgi:hypothetical protein